jgi:hypothetical protein
LPGSVATDGVFYTSDELLGGSDDDFFKTPSISPIDEVDYNLRKKPEIAYFDDNKWTLRRQMSVKAKGIPEQVIECEVVLHCIFLKYKFKYFCTDIECFFE